MIGCWAEHDLALALALDGRSEQKRQRRRGWELVLVLVLRIWMACPHSEGCTSPDPSPAAHAMGYVYDAR